MVFTFVGRDSGCVADVREVFRLGRGSQFFLFRLVVRYVSSFSIGEYDCNIGKSLLRFCVRDWFLKSMGFSIVNTGIGGGNDSS